MNSTVPGEARLLIVDDEERNIRVLRYILERAGYIQICSTCDSREALQLFTQFEPDLVLLDLHMPHLDGVAVMQQISATIAEDAYLPFLILTADVTVEARQRALAEGAKDFLTKPLDATEVLLRIKNLLDTRFLNKLLEQKVWARTADLEKSQSEVLNRLAQAAEFRDDDTGQHTYRVGGTAARLAEELRQESELVDLIRRAAPLHDVGKIGIPDAILLKPGKLTAEEFDIMKTHTTIGAALLAEGQSPLVQMAQSISLTHHEKWNGSGYPHGLSGEAIPIEGRILAVVDVFDALTHERPYKKAWPVEEALTEIAQQSGRHFDPQIVTAFLALPHQTLLTEHSQK
jgi:putative two-component system response regulator